MFSGKPRCLEDTPANPSIRFNKFQRAHNEHSRAPSGCLRPLFVISWMSPRHHHAIQSAEGDDAGGAPPFHFQHKTHGLNRPLLVAPQHVEAPRRLKTPILLGDTSPFFPGILLFRKPAESKGKQRSVCERNDVEKNGTGITP